MSQRDGHEWNVLPLGFFTECCEDGCQRLAAWEKVLIACDKSSYDGGSYCHQHAAENGNLMAQDEKVADNDGRYIDLYNAAVEAIEHLAQANWSEREQAAKRYLYLVAKGGEYGTKSLVEIQEEINLG